MTTLHTQDTFASPFQVEALVREAQERAGTADNDALDFLEALEVLARSLDTEAGLSPTGRTVVRNGLISSLLTQFALQRNTQEHPEIRAVQIQQPVFIIGLLRTGSTLVHNLFAQHPGLCVPNLWELLFPAAPATSSQEQEELANKGQAYVDEYFQVAPQLKALHFLDARRPDECHRLLGNTFQSMVYEMRYRVPGYSRWLRERDLTQAYAYHRLQLQHILWRRPGDVVVLKCPFHTWNLEALSRVYPSARFIFLHRDPTAATISTCSLCAAIRPARSDTVDHVEIGQHWLPHIERGLERMQEARDTCLQDKAVFDVRYTDLIRDPLAVMDQVCTFIGVPMTEQAERQMRQYLADNRQHKHGVHRYTAEEFGLDSRELDERFGAYRSRYDL